MRLTRTLATLYRAARAAASNAFADQRQREMVGPGVTFGAGVILRGADRIAIGTGSFVDTRAYIAAGTVNDKRGFVRIGRGCEIGPYCVLWGGGGIDIGDNVHLGAHVHVTSQQGRAIAPEDRRIGKLTVDCEPVRIGDHVLIYSGAIVVQGVTIGHHSIVAAGAVVTRDVPAHSLAIGVPARVVSRNPSDPVRS